jgi:hypothetical protein
MMGRFTEHKRRGEAIMRVQALWYGGSNYSNPDPDRDLEPFDSIRAAVSAFDARFSDRYYPCVEEDQAEMHLYLGEYSENGPDRIVRCGRRGGIKVERC